MEILLLLRVPTNRLYPCYNFFFHFQTWRIPKRILKGIYCIYQAAEGLIRSMEHMYFYNNDWWQFSPSNSKLIFPLSRHVKIFAIVCWTSLMKISEKLLGKHSQKVLIFWLFEAIFWLRANFCPLFSYNFSEIFLYLKKVGVHLIFLPTFVPYMLIFIDDPNADQIIPL